MYGKIFDTIYNGTLVKDWKALITFQQFIVLSDADGIVDITPDAISSRTGIPIEYILHGIAVLEKRDCHSRSQSQNGKRIMRLDDHRDWGWFIVNHEKYKNLKDSNEVRENNRLRKQKQRNSEKSHDVTRCHTMSRHIDTDIDTNTNITNKDLKEKRSVQKKVIFPKELNSIAFIEYLHHRIQIKVKKLKPISEERLITWLIQQGGYKTQAEIVNYTIRNGYTGLFKLKENQNELSQKTRGQRVNEKLNQIGQEDIDSNWETEKTDLFTTGHRGNDI